MSKVCYFSPGNMQQDSLKGALEIQKPSDATMLESGGRNKLWNNSVGVILCV